MIIMAYLAAIDDIIGPDGELALQQRPVLPNFDRQLLIRTSRPSIHYELYELLLKPIGTKPDHPASSSC